MLSERRVEEIYYLMFCHFLSQRRKGLVGRIDMAENGGKCYGLLGNNRLVAVSKHPASVKALIGFNNSIIYNYNFSKSEVAETHVVDADRCWTLKINEKYDHWEHNMKFFSEEELMEYILNNQKVAALDFMHDKIEFYRKEVNEHLPNQGTVYIRKYLEAKEILQKGIEKDDTLQYPLVSGYAKHKNTTVHEAANIIVLQYDMESSFLAESENIRIKYTDIIREETDIKRLKEIVQDFYTEHYFYGGSL